MASLKDQFDIEDALFDVLVNLIYNTLSVVGAPVLGIPTTVFASYLALLTPWNTIYEITKVKSGTTPTDRVARDKAKANLTDFLRLFVKKWLYDNMPPCTNVIIKSLGLKPHSLSRTSHAGIPVIKATFRTVPNANHGFDCLVLDTAGKKAKPEGVAIIRVRYFVGEDAPANPALFTSFRDYSKQPITLPVGIEAAGLPIAMASCYVNASGQEGPYSTVVVTKVP